MQWRLCAVLRLTPLRSGWQRNNPGVSHISLVIVEQLNKLSSVNIRSLIPVFSLVLFFFIPLQAICGDPAAITQEELVRRTQELFDAVVPGNKEPWQKYFADDCIFADEKGRNLNKTQLVADITPLPKGYSGAIKIVKSKSVIHGDTAILSYDLDETETIFGQKLSARYHVTDTWLQRDGVWQIASSQAMRYYEDPAVARIDPKNSPISAVPTSWRPAKPGAFSPKVKICMWSVTENVNNFCPRGPKSFFAKASKAASYFARRIMGKWTP